MTKQWKRGIIDQYPNSYEDFILIGDFNESKTSSALHSFLYEQKCKNIIKNKTCFKSVKRSCIDLILTSRPSLHQFTNVFETEISDHHLLIYTMLKPTYTKPYFTKKGVCSHEKIILVEKRKFLEKILKSPKHTITILSICLTN